jgi:hypothetical protein
LGKFVRRALGTSVTSAGVSRDVPCVHFIYTFGLFGGKPLISGHSHSQEMIAAMRALDERDVA